MEIIEKWNRGYEGHWMIDLNGSHALPHGAIVVL